MAGLEGGRRGPSKLEEGECRDSPQSFQKGASPAHTLLAAR